MASRGDLANPTVVFVPAPRIGHIQVAGRVKDRVVGPGQPHLARAVAIRTDRTIRLDALDVAIADVQTMLSILTNAADKAIDSGKLLKFAPGQVNPVDLTRFAAGIGIAITAPSNALGVVEAAAKVADNR